MLRLTFAVTSAKTVAVFQSSLKLVREEDRPNSLTRIINIQHSKDQNVYTK